MPAILPGSFVGQGDPEEEQRRKGYRMAIRLLGKWLWFGAAGLSLLVIGCSGGSSDNATDGTTAVDRIRSIAQRLSVDPNQVDQTFVTQTTDNLKKLDAYATELRQLMATQSPESARNQMVQRLSADPMVEQVAKSLQGLSVQYKNGLRAAIMLDPRDRPQTTAQTSGAKAFVPNSLVLKAVGPDAGARKTLFMDPHYWERKDEADQIVQTANARFLASGLEPFVQYLGTDCTLDRYQNLQDYSVVHLTGHAWPYPSEENVQEVYLMTGEPADPFMIGLFKLGGLIPDEILPVNIVFGSSDKKQALFFISPRFIARWNNFNDQKTLLYLGFCYSGKGTWRDTMDTGAQAGASISFDGAVPAASNASWALSMYNNMGDRTGAGPASVGSWYDNVGRQVQFYDLDKDRNVQLYTVNILLTGDPQLTLWDANN
jgi:hypothetical protein